MNPRDLEPEPVGEPTALPEGRCVLETRRLTPAMTRHVLELLDALGFDPARVGEVRITTAADGLTAHVTHIPQGLLHTVRA